MRTASNSPSQAAWDGGVKLTTDTGKKISAFSMKVFFYDSRVDTNTGEVTQAQWTYVGWRYKRRYAMRNMRFPSELDVLLHILKDIQLKVELAIIYDNSLPGEDAEIFRVEKGVTNEVKNKIKGNPSYPISIPPFKFTKHTL